MGKRSFGASPHKCVYLDELTNALDSGGPGALRCDLLGADGGASPDGKEAMDMTRSLAPRWVSVR